MTRATRKRGISITLWEFKSGYILPKRGERARLRRQSHRLDRQMAKAQLRNYAVEDWEAGELNLPPIFPTSTSCNGSTIYLGEGS